MKGLEKQGMHTTLQPWWHGHFGELGFGFYQQISKGHLFLVTRIFLLKSLEQVSVYSVVHTRRQIKTMSCLYLSFFLATVATVVLPGPFRPHSSPRTSSPPWCPLCGVAMSLAYFYKTTGFTYTQFKDRVFYQHLRWDRVREPRFILSSSPFYSSRVMPFPWHKVGQPSEGRLGELKFTGEQSNSPASSFRG